VIMEFHIHILYSDAFNGLTIVGPNINILL